jgi:hypothetical protein
MMLLVYVLQDACTALILKGYFVIHLSLAVFISRKVCLKAERVEQAAMVAFLKKEKANLYLSS